MQPLRYVMILDCAAIFDVVIPQDVDKGIPQVATGDAC
jgi:hypothetical protein